MKKCALFGTMFLFLLSCQKNEPETEAQKAIGAWNKLADIPAEGTYDGVSFALGQKGYLGLGFPHRQEFFAFDPVNGNWESKAKLPIGRNGAVGFAYRNKGYVLCGKGNDSQLGDFWEYDPMHDRWTQLADFPGMPRYNASGMVIGDKAYFGTGWTDLKPGSQLQLKDWWEYDFTNQTWTQRAAFPGGPCAIASAIGLEKQGYLGLAGPGPEPGTQWWAYNPTTNQWTRKSDFPGRRRYGAAVFVLDGRIFAGNGIQGYGNEPANYLFDWHVYDSIKDQWSPVTSQVETRLAAYTFVLGKSAYLGMGFSEGKGVLKDFWRFDLE
jgi:N-acetylneuraminic acid mutarotase